MMSAHRRTSVPCFLLATVGLFLDSASVIIGAMVLAPLMAPIISLSMSMLRYDQRLPERSGLSRECTRLHWIMKLPYVKYFTSVGFA